MSRQILSYDSYPRPFDSYPRPFYSSSLGVLPPKLYNVLSNRVNLNYIQPWDQFEIEKVDGGIFEAKVTFPGKILIVLGKYRYGSKEA